MDVKTLLDRLSAMAAPSGSEAESLNIAAELIAPYTDTVSIDRMGNLIAERSCGKAGAKKLLIDAHLDQISMVVSGVKEGFLAFRPMGGVDKRLLLAQEVTVLTEPPLQGIISCMPPHLQEREDMEKAPDFDELFIDIGLSQEQAEKAVELGAGIIFTGEGFEMLNGCYCAKAMDNRSCFAALIMALEKLRGRELNIDLVVLGSAMEESGMAGAETAAFSIRPDYALVVDVTFAKAHKEPQEELTELNGGVAISIGPTISKSMSSRLGALAEKQGIRHQIEPLAGSSGTNAMRVQLTAEGIPTGLLSLPLRYMHSNLEVVSMEDMETLAELIAAFALSF